MRGYFDIAEWYGGEKFLLIFDETDEKRAISIVERIRKK
jgi:PleD family two-component response regulator